MEEEPPIRGAVTQLSTLHALASGLFHGLATVGSMAKHGDFGLGTFENLDGELIFLEGKAFRYTASEVLEQCQEQDLVAFYVVTSGPAVGTSALEQGMRFSDLRQYVDACLSTANVTQAIRVDGFFRRVWARTLPRQAEPYPSLIEVPQHRFDAFNLEGTLLGFRCPEYLQSVNLSGYHLHFLDKDRQTGGHVIDFEIERAVFQVDAKPEYRLRIPDQHPAFRRLGHIIRSPSELEMIEG